MSASQALERFGSPACLPDLDRLAAGDPAAAVRAAAAQAAKAVRSR
jgi:HEAT repeat protein